MPERLEEIEINCDINLEKWASGHEDDYVDTKAYPTKLQKCVATDQEDALESQRG